MNKRIFLRKKQKKILRIFSVQLIDNFLVYFNDKKNQNIFNDISKVRKQEERRKKYKICSYKLQKIFK